MSADAAEIAAAPAPAHTLSGWGGLGVPGRELRSEDLARITEDVPLSRGLGRSYGDASLPPPGRVEVANTVLADRILGFDADTGVLRAEAGLALDALRRVFLKRGFFTPVSPGTQFVTLGGAVASDVHGKNHHVAGTIGRHVRSLRMRVADGRVIEVSRAHHPHLFRATLGGMGLTGHILEVELTLERIPSPWIFQESFRVRDVDALVGALRESADAWPQTVAWIDCLAKGRALGRGVVQRGRWATAAEAPGHLPPDRPGPSVPFNLPSWSINDLTTGLFNALYYRRPLHSGIEAPTKWFYPLDAIGHWYRLYGRAGMTQHQCVIPHDAPDGSVRRYMELVAKLGGTSPVCVLKDCGPEGEGMLSFPRPGVSVALDFPVRAHTQEVLDTLNRFVVDVGGRIYLTKDGFSRADHFRAMEPRLDAFLSVRRQWDPDGRLASAQSVRLFGW